MVASANLKFFLVDLPSSIANGGGFHVSRRFRSHSNEQDVTRSPVNARANADQRNLSRISNESIF
jgi:hypothetical protein